jgi:hypothetical protein
MSRAARLRWLVNDVEPLLDDLIRPLEHVDWNCQADLFRRLEVDNEFKLRCLLYRQVSRFGAFQDLVHVKEWSMGLFERWSIWISESITPVLHRPKTPIQQLVHIAARSCPTKFFSGSLLKLHPFPKTLPRHGENRSRREGNLSRILFCHRRSN